MIPRTGEPRTPHGLILIRLRELEIHHVDLAVGYTFDDIPEEAASWIINDIVDTLSGRSTTPPIRLVADDAELDREIGSRGPVVSGSQADLLGWLSGRLPGTGLAVEGADEVPSAPVWI